MKRIAWLMVLLAVGCGGKRAAVLKEHQRVQTEAAVKRAVTTERLKGMSPAALAEALAQDAARGLEPFNSSAFKETVARDGGAADAIAATLTRGAPASFLGLLALRQIDPARYRGLAPGLRTQILVETLRTEKYFNAFGLPHTRREAAAQAVVEEGDNAVRPLAALLNAKRPAPVWGSEDYVEYKRYGFRVCDYALAYLGVILDKKFEITTDAAARDRLIAALASELANRPPK